MKRYGLNEFGQLASESQAGGDYVLFTDAQADKHAALKELALLVLPHVKHTDACDQSNIGSLCDCGKFALISKLKSLTEGPV